ncbi:MAG: helix-turn-helix transcriptional regulator [Crocinitomicaceae bacterium]|jgi:transcriptional regulator with XRE-family HTH domain|nr:helix-turn-helix transcriptional regulator [Crocinitomicaceae bacterium]
MLRFGISKNPTDVLQEIAERFQKLRKQHNYSQQQMAERSGVSLGSIKRFERTGLISLDSLLKVAHVLDALEQFDTLFLPKEDLSHIEKLFSNQSKRK